jgi:hypothetical protein
MKDSEIIKAALDANLCFPICWDLVEFDHSIVVDEEDAPTRELQMEKLRIFAHLIIERTKSNV